MKFCKVRLKQDTIKVGYFITNSAASESQLFLLNELVKSGVDCTILIPKEISFQKNSKRILNRLIKLHKLHKLKIIVINPGKFKKMLQENFFCHLGSQTLYIDDYLKKYAETIKNFKSSFYFPYGLNYFMQAASPILRIELLNNFTQILVESQEISQIIKVRFPDKKGIHAIGNPFIFEVRRRNILEFNPKPKQILWSPHWTEKISTWEEVLPYLFEIAVNNPDLKIVVSAHPFLSQITDLKVPDAYKRSKTKSKYSLSMLKRFLKLRNVENVGKSLIAEIIKSDICITDGVSMIAYFGCTGKPIIITGKSLDNFISFNIEFNESDTIQRVSDFETLPTFINSLIHSSEEARHIARLNRYDLFMRMYPTDSISPGEKLGKLFALEKH